MLMQKINNQKGFDLIEAMVVMAIIGILAAIAIPHFIAYRNKQIIKSEPVQIITQQEEKIPTPSKQKEATEQKGEMNKL